MSQTALSAIAQTLLAPEGSVSTCPPEVAPPGVCRDPELALARDARGVVGIRREDRAEGLALIGGRGTGKTSLLCQTVRSDARDRHRAVVVLTTTREDALKALSAVPADRNVHFLDLAAPEIGFNPLADGSPPADIANDLAGALADGQFDAARDDAGLAHRYLIDATRAAVCGARGGAVDGAPSFWQAYRALLPEEGEFRRRLAQASTARAATHGASLLTSELIDGAEASSTHAASLEAAGEQLARVLVTPVDQVVRHPAQISLDDIVRRGEVLIVAANTDTPAASGQLLLARLLLSGLYRSFEREQSRVRDEPLSVAVKIDDAHLILTERLARRTQELRREGLDVVVASAHVPDGRGHSEDGELVSLLQHRCLLSQSTRAAPSEASTRAESGYVGHGGAQREAPPGWRVSQAMLTRLARHEVLCSWIITGVRAPAFTARVVPNRANARRVEHHLAVQASQGARRAQRLSDPLPGLGSHQLDRLHARIAAAAQGYSGTRAEAASSGAQAAPGHRATRASAMAGGALAAGGSSDRRHTQADEVDGSAVGRFAQATRTAAHGLPHPRLPWVQQPKRRSAETSASAAVKLEVRDMRTVRLGAAEREGSELDEFDSEQPQTVRASASVEPERRGIPEDSRLRPMLLAGIEIPRVRLARRNVPQPMYAHATQPLVAFVGLTVVVVLVLTLTVLAGVAALEKAYGSLGQNHAPALKVRNSSGKRDAPPGESEGPPNESSPPSSELPDDWDANFEQELEQLLAESADALASSSNPTSPPARVSADSSLSDGGIPGWTIPIFSEAGVVFDVNPYLLASVADQESTFGSGTAWESINYAGCVGFMQTCVGGQGGDSWDSSVTLTSHPRLTLPERYAYRLGVRPSSYPDEASTHPDYNDPFDAVMTAAVELRGKVSGRPIPDLDDTAYEALCGYYGACSDSVAAYAPTVLSRAQAWQAEGTFGGGGSASAGSRVIETSSPLSPNPAQELAQQLSTVSATQLANVSDADLISAFDAVQSGIAPVSSPIQLASYDTATSPAAAEALAFALAQVGSPYVYGGNGQASCPRWWTGSTGCFDCSGLTLAAYRTAGIELPRVAQDQYDAGPRVRPGAALEPGDLVFFGTGASAVQHVGIVVRAGKTQGTMVDAPHTGARVRIEPFPTEPGTLWGKSQVYIGATRPAASSATVGSTA